MSADHTDIKIFAGSASREFVTDMCRQLGAEQGLGEAIRFSEGNTFVKINEKVRDKDVYVVQTIGMDPNNEFMELLFWIDAFKRSSASSVTAILPFFSYSKGDKKDEPRVSIRARVCADCLEASGVDRIITMDLHSPQIQGFFKKPVDHMYGMPILCDEIRKLNLPDLVVVSPDAGFAKNARRYAQFLDAGIAHGDKVRTCHDENAEILEIVGDVRGKNALIVDDFTISCGTIAETAKKLVEAGAVRVLACVTHAPITRKGLERLEQSPVERLYITDTVRNEPAFIHPKVQVVSVAGFFAECVRIIHDRDSLSQLFDSMDPCAMR